MKLKLTSQQKELLEFVKTLHYPQVRKYTGVPYWEHVVRVAEIVDEHLKEPNLIEIAFCHDLFEDTDCDSNRLGNFLHSIGYSINDRSEILDGVKSLTDVYTKEDYPELNRSKRKALEAERLGKLFPIFQSIKYADLIDNTSSIVTHDRKFADTYLKEKVQLLDKMRQGDITLFIRCCAILQSSLNFLKETK